LDRPDRPAGQDLEQSEQSPLATRHQDLAMSAIVRFARQHRPCPATERPPQRAQCLEIGRSSAAPLTGSSLSRRLTVDGVDNKANGRFCRLAGARHQPQWYSLLQSALLSGAHSGPREVGFTSHAGRIDVPITPVRRDLVRFAARGSRSARGRSRGAITRLDVGMGYSGSMSDHFRTFLD
jgi:hypothetical protein